MAEPKEKRRFEGAVVGVTFEGRQDIISELYGAQEDENGVALTGQLTREAQNRFDSNAVAVEVGGKQIGYIPKALAAKLAPRIDSGKPIDVIGVRIIKGEKDGQAVYGVRIDVEMEASEKEAV